VIGRRRTILYAALALAIPLPALALTGGGGDAGLSVEASLAGCGVSGGGIVCEIETSFGSIDGAEYYTASVTAPDGGVTDFGRVAGAGGGGTSLWVPYVGNGTYSVTVTAWGEDEQSGGPKVVDRDRASATNETEKLRESDVERVGEGTYEVPEGEEQTEPPAEQPAEVPPAPPCEPAQAPAPPEAPPASELEGSPADPGAEGSADASQSGEVAPSAEVAPSTEPAAPDCPPAAPAPAPAPPAP
jgi:hypothetical protein